MIFKDHFSEGSAEYNVYRPGYPKELFSYLSSISQNNERAWDCATGNGQSALGLIRHFDLVIATDASKNQIDNAVRVEGVTYKVEVAENTSIANNSIDLITVAQALHWFDTEQFSNEVMRVLKTNGILAAWTYGLFDVNPELNKVIKHLYSNTLESYWPPERRTVEEGYKNIKLPFHELDAPSFQMELQWELSQFIGYLCTWSAVKKYEISEGVNPVESVYKEISGLWGDPKQKKLIRWPLVARLWKKGA